MKKFAAVSQLLIIFAFLVKGLSGVAIINKTGVPESLFSTAAAVADSAVENRKDSMPSSIVNEGTEESSWSQTSALVESLLKKEKKLNERETALDVEKQRLAALKQDIVAKIDELYVLRDNLTADLFEREERIKALVDELKGMKEKRYKDLAKLYEAAPPSQAAVMLEKIDKKTAAAIVMNMKSKVAGVVLGNMTPGKAVEITKEITSIDPSSQTSDLMRSQQ